VPASWGWIAKVRQRLADDPALVDIMDGRGAPLHEAAREGHLDIVKLLMDAGADARRPNADGKTPLDLARERADHAGCLKVAERLAGG
jgi:ankyrin repeat protein